jgi:hypothetical protein
MENSKNDISQKSNNDFEIISDKFNSKSSSDSKSNSNSNQETNIFFNYENNNIEKKYAKIFCNKNILAYFLIMKIII